MIMENYGKWLFIGTVPKNKKGRVFDDRYLLPYSVLKQILKSMPV